MFIRLNKFEYYKDLILVLTEKEIKVKYKNSFLGYLWSILHPLSLAIVFYFAFKFIMRVKVEHYVLFLISGLFPWQWFSNSVSASSNLLLANNSLIKKVYFPRYFIPLATVLNDAFHFVVSIPIILGFALFYNISPTLEWLYGIPLLIISQFFVTFGFSLFISAINVFFRDMERLVNIGLNILFYLTPVIYSINLIPEKFKFIFLLNPLSGIIEGWHRLFLKGEFDISLYLLSLLQSIIVFIIGFIIFRRLSWKFAEVI